MTVAYYTARLFSHSMKAHNSTESCFFMGWLEGGGRKNNEADTACCKICMLLNTGALPLKLCEGAVSKVRN